MLEKFGLTKTEERVYLKLLQLGISPASRIIKKTQLHRTTVYDVLERLIEKGFASYIVENKIKSYIASNPSKILDIIMEEKKMIENKEKSAKEIIKKINPIRDKNVKSVAQIFVGEKSEKTIMEEIIEVGKEFYVLGSGGSFRETIPFYTEQWAEKRRAKNIHAKIISTHAKNAPVWHFNSIRYINREYESPTSTIIYGNKVAFFIQEEPILIILIESDKLANDYITYFNLLWKIARK